MSHTRVALFPDPGGGRPRLELGVRTSAPRGTLRPRLLDIAADVTRVALVAEGALLLRGDDVRVEVVVGAGVRLELVEPSGTVAYAMRDGSATWAVDVTVESGGTLVWHGQPFVVAEGADVRRTTTVRLAEGACLLQREILVLGRSGEDRGRLAASMRVEQASRPVLVEDLRVGGASPAVGVLGAHRVMDTLLAFGQPAPPAVPDIVGVHSYRLAGGGTMVRGLAGASHQASLSSMWRHLSAA